MIYIPVANFGTHPLEIKVTRIDRLGPTPVKSDPKGGPDKIGSILRVQRRLALLHSGPETQIVLKKP